MSLDRQLVVVSLLQTVTERRDGATGMPRRSELVALAVGVALAASVLVASAITAYVRGVTVIRAPGSTVVVPVGWALLTVTGFVLVAALATAYCRLVRRELVRGALDVASGVARGEIVDQQYALARWRETRVLAELEVIRGQGLP